MKDELTAFPTAIIAKKKGFNEGSVNFYHTSGEYTMTTKSIFRDIPQYDVKNENGYIEAPTQTSLQSWLREKHKIYVYVIPNDVSGWDVVVKFNDEKEIYADYRSWEIALEKGNMKDCC